eukprot:scaffold8068_cov565-Prasinococcus_capsulatus_cf.AAC.8
MPHRGSSLVRRRARRIRGDILRGGSDVAAKARLQLPRHCPLRPHLASHDPATSRGSQVRLSLSLPYCRSSSSSSSNSSSLVAVAPARVRPCRSCAPGSRARHRHQRRRRKKPLAVAAVGVARSLARSFVGRRLPDARDSYRVCVTPRPPAASDVSARAEDRAARPPESGAPREGRQVCSGACVDEQLEPAGVRLQSAAADVGGPPRQPWRRYPSSQAPSRR